MKNSRENNRMEKHVVEGKYRRENQELGFVLSLMQFMEDDNIVIYSPATDICGYGKTESDAKESFEIAIEEFIRYTINKGTFEIVLKEMGWNISGGKNKKKYKQPFFDKLLQEKAYLQEIMREKDFSKFQHEVKLAI